MRKKVAEVAEGAILHGFEPPDLIVARYVGHIDGHHVRAASEEARPFIARSTYFFVLYDVKRLDSVTADARRASTENGDGRKMRGIAVIGASFHFKAVGGLVARAAALIQRHVDNPVRFFDTEEEARVWFDERRRALAAKAPGRAS